MQNKALTPSIQKRNELTISKQRPVTTSALGVVLNRLRNRCCNYCNPRNRRCSQNRNQYVRRNSSRRHAFYSSANN